MKSITSAIQSIIDADANHPVTIATITLTDSTVLRVATRAVSYGGNSYVEDLVSEPQIVVSALEGIDHVGLVLNNADWAYGTYHNDNLFEGAIVSISQIFATDAGYTTFEGPVQSFSGTAIQPVAGPGTINLTVVADARAVAGGSVGRVITGECLNVFGSDDANCGYSYSATVASGGSYTAGDWVPLSESPTTEQPGIALEASSDGWDTIKIDRSGTPVYTGVAITETDLDNQQVKFDTTMTLSSGDKIVYEYCPQNTMRACARRWLLGSSSRQQDNFMGFDYHRPTPNLLVFDYFPYTLATWPNIIVVTYKDNLGRPIPIPFGQRWIKPVILGVHAPRKKSQEDWVAWNSAVRGPLAVVLIGEGPVSTGIEDVDDDILLDGAPLSFIQHYHDGISDKVDILTGSASQAVSDLVPGWDVDVQTIPGYASLQNLAYVVIDLPDDYEISKTIGGRKGVGGSVLTPEQLAQLPQHPPGERPQYDVAAPDISIRYKGLTVGSWAYSGGSPAYQGAAFSKNPIWQAYHLLTATYRTDENDAYGIGLTSSDLDLASFILWGEYADETIDVLDSAGSPTTATRFESNAYLETNDRGEALDTVLEAARARLVYRGGKIGVVCDAPTGGKGTLTGVSGTTLTDSDRDGITLPSWPTGGLAGGLYDLKCEMLDGNAAGQVRSIDSNTGDSWDVASAFSPAPNVGDTYAIYAVSLTTDNVGDIEVRRIQSAHELYNKYIVQFDDEDHAGLPATVPIVTSDDEEHIANFGLRERTISLPATTTWQQAVREGWYRLRKQMDLNWEVEIHDCNIEAMPLEVGDTFLLNHDMDGISDEVFKVTKISSSGTMKYTIIGQIYRDEIYLDWPIFDAPAVRITSNLVPPHSVPPHVESGAVNMVYETEGEPPLVVCSYDLPRWPYVGWRVDVEGRYYDADTTTWSEWVKYGESKTATCAFRAPRLGLFQFRPIFVSHVGIRADDPWSSGTSSGSNTSSTLNDTSKSWPTNLFDGASVEITGGTGYDADDPQIEEIASNTLTELTLVGTWSTTPDATSTYKVYVPGTAIQQQIYAGIGFGTPFLDEDDGDLYLIPNELLGESCKWYDSDTEPTLSDVQTYGTLLTKDATDRGGVLVHSYTLDGEVRYVGIIFYLDDAGTEGESELYVVRHTYHAADDRPEVTWHSFIPTTVNKEGIRLVAVDDGGQCTLYYRTYTDGDTPPSYSDTGLQSDPVVVELEVSRPAEGDADTIVEFYAEDADGNLSGNGVAIQVRVDGNLRPSGTYSATIDENNEPIIRFSTTDPDTGSWRARYNVTTNPAQFNAIAYDDGYTNEDSGNSFNGETMSYVSGALAEDEMVNVELMFYRTTSIVDSDQQASMKSQAVRFTVHNFKDTVVPTFLAVPGKNGSDHELTITVNDPKGYVNAHSFETQVGGTYFEPDADPANWSGFDGTATVTSETVAATEKHNSYIAATIRYDLGDGNGNQWATPVIVTFDSNTLPNFSAFLTLDGDQPRLSWFGDDDMASGSLEYVYSTSSMPGSFSGSSTTDGRTGNIALGSGLSEGETLYVRARGWTGTGGSGTESTEDWTGQISYAGGIPPTVKAIPSQTASVGTMTLSVSDPGSYLTAIAFETQSGPGAFSPDSNPANWTVYRTTPISDWDHTVNLSSKHSSYIAWGVGYDMGGGTEWITGVATYSATDVAEVTNCSLSFDDSDQIVVTAGGDEDTASLHFRVTGDGSTPGDPDGTGSDSGSIAARSGVDTTSVTCAYGQTAKVKIAGKNSGGTLGPILSFQQVRESVPPALSSLDLFVEDTGASGNNVYTVSWSHNSGVNASDHDVELLFFENEAFVGSTTVTDPTDDGKVWTDTGAGDGLADYHHCELLLKDSSGYVIQSLRSRREISAV